jgi:hypothetical protein
MIFYRMHSQASKLIIPIDIIILESSLEFFSFLTRMDVDFIKWFLFFIFFYLGWMLTLLIKWFSRPTRARVIKPYHI